jgi:predicted NBD/HSP70 family sugar kinase
VAKAVQDAMVAASATPDRLRGVVIGLPGLVAPDTGDVGFSFDLPRWGDGVRVDLESRLGVPVTIDNDVNLAAVAEQRDGAARGASDFVLLWVGRGIGSAIVMGGEVHRGASGAAGELGYLPVPGVELPRHISRRDKGAFQRLAGEDAILEAARSHGVGARSLREAIGSGDEALLDDVARRLAVGVAAVCAVVDPGLVVLSGPVALAGGAGLCERIAHAVAAIAPVHPRVVPADLGEAAVLRGAHVVALGQARHLVAAG